MDKFTFKTADGVDVNLEKLSRDFPEVITETVGEDGKIKRVADFEKLKMLLGDSAAERPQEFYEFTWPGKNEAIFEAAKATTKTLRLYPEESKNWDTTQNLYIEGDNLEALKILQEAYLGKVKMIYIDPPYNTGKDFVYRDNFHKSAEEGKADESVRDEETDNNLFQNTESNGRFHSDWCSMIYPRLKLARDLLRDDGVIFISIDDNEVHNLRKICDEIFGESNFVANIVWQSTIGSNTGENTITTVTENILCYSRTKNKIINKEKFVNDGKMRFSDSYFETRGHYALDKLDSIRQSSHYSDALNYPITCPDGRIRYPGGEDTKQNGWNYLWSKNKVDWGIKNDFIVFKKDGDDWNIYNKRYEFVDNKGDPIERGNIFKNLVLSSFCTTSTGAKEIDDLDLKLFDYPKSVKLLHKFLSIGTQKNSLILDFFSGSATTAHACMQLNAEDGGNRKFIMVQLPEVCTPDSEAAKAGYKNICEIGKERIRRAGEKIKAEHATTAPNLDIGFRVLKIDESIMKDVFYSPNETSQDLLSTLESNIKEDRTDLDLLFACLVDWGVELSMPLKTEEIEGVEIHTMSDGDTPALIACFAQNIPETVVRKIAARHPLRAVFRDSSFADSPAKINLTEIFKTYSPETEIRIL